MAEPVDVVCHTCRIVLPLLDSPVGREAWWKFLDEHAYHQVELMWEHSEAQERIDIDYIEVGSDIRSDPSFAEYAGDWPGRPLALHPRPTARAVAEIVERAFTAMDADKWQAAPADAVAAERIMQHMDFAPPPGELDAFHNISHVRPVQLRGWNPSRSGVSYRRDDAPSQAPGWSIIPDVKMRSRPPDCASPWVAARRSGQPST